MTKPTSDEPTTNEPITVILMLNNMTDRNCEWSIAALGHEPIVGTQERRTWSMVSVPLSTHYTICFEGVCAEGRNPNSCASFDGSKVVITEPGA